MSVHQEAFYRKFDFSFHYPTKRNKIQTKYAQTENNKRRKPEKNSNFSLPFCEMFELNMPIKEEKRDSANHNTICGFPIENVQMLFWVQASLPSR